MLELWTTIETDEVLSENLEVHYDFGALLIAWCIRRCNPIALNGTIGEDAGIEVSRFASLAVKPQASSEIHAPNLPQ